MALSKKSSVDQTLELVRDADKFKKRIKELAKAELDANASIAKANAKSKEQREEADKFAKDMQAQRKFLDAKIKTADNGAAVAKSAAKEILGKSEKLDAKIAKREEKLEEEKKNLEDTYSDFAEEKAALRARMIAFDNLVKSVASI